jgi:hypothetical protein
MMEEQLLDLGFVKWPDDMIMKPFRTYFAYHDTKGGLHEVTLKRGRAYLTDKKYIKFETFIENFKRDYGNKNN